MPDLTVAENLLLQAPPRGRSGLVRRARLVPEADALLRRFGVEDIGAGIATGELSVAQRQVARALVRVLASEPRVVILDEPTAALAEQQVEWLSGHMRRLRDEGCCVIFTSHRWREIEALADRVTVFRNGTHVTTRDRLGEAEAVTLMSGRTIAGAYPDVTGIPLGGSALRVDGLRGGMLRRGLIRPAQRRDPRRRRARRAGAAGPVPHPVRRAASDRRHDRRRQAAGDHPPTPAGDRRWDRHRLRAGGPQGRGPVVADAGADNCPWRRPDRRSVFGFV